MNNCEQHINSEIRQNTIGETETSPEGHNHPIKSKKNLIKTKLKERMTEMIMSGTNKTKTKFYLDNKKDYKPGQRARYIDECNRMEASTIFKARTRMLRVKHNYRKMFPDTKCRACNMEEETQEHILEACTRIDRKNAGKITIEDIFEEEPKKIEGHCQKNGLHHG